MPGAASRWFRQHAYGQFTYRILLALVSALVTVALSFLPYDTLLQAIWVVVSSMVIGYLILRQRLDETDETRYRRLFTGRFEYLSNADPEALTTIFADNIRLTVLDWFESEYKIPIRKAKNIDALDSLARVGDQPGRLLLRFGVEMGKWMDATPENNTIDRLENEVSKFVADNTRLLGKEVGPGIFLRTLKRGDRRPVGVHLFHAKSRCLFTVENYSEEQSEDGFSVALSAKSGMFDGLTEEQWLQFKHAVHSEFPYFHPARGGSGPQTAKVPLFVRAGLEAWTEEEKVTAAKLQRLMQLMT